MNIPSIDSPPSLKVPNPANPAAMGEKTFHDPKPACQTLDQIFQQDRLKEPLASAAAAAAAPAKPSFWEYLLSCFSFPWKKLEANTNKGSGLPGLETGIQVPPLKPLNPIPEIEKPEGIPFTWTPSKNVKESDQEVSLPWVKEGLNLTSSSTIEQVIFLILKSQLELEKEIAEMAETTFKHQEMALQLKEKILEQVKEALEKDEKVAGYFKTAERLTIAAGILSTVAIAVIFAPPTLFGAGAAMISGFATGFLKGSALVIGFKTALEAYFKQTANQNKASFQNVRHERMTHQVRMDEIHQHLISVSESNNSFRELWAKEIKRIDKIIRLILQK